ncbi:MAG: protease [Bacteroidetes bacterium]|nr:MAG: protease [Bacteroidota bacterium]
MKKTLFIISFILFLFSEGFSQQEARLLRFPTVHQNQVVFTCAGDLYSVAKQGGIARKLTNDIGYEMFAKFSPDGKQIAFTGQYDGNTEVYLMPSQGGVPKRITYTATLHRDDVSDRMGPNNIVMSWTNDGKNIVYRSRKQSFNSFIGQLFKVPITGGLSQELPFTTGGFCSYSPDGKKLAYNRVFREFRTWKYYRGGMADDIWVYDFDKKETVNITNNLAQDIIPMWHNDDIYFLSDRERIMNLFVYNIKSKQTKKVTKFTEYDIKFPSLGDQDIVFENGGYIYTFNFETQQTKKVDIKIANDLISSRNTLKDAAKFIEGVDIAPDGKRLVLSARGDVFTTPAEHGITRNLTETSNIHDREAVWSPDGKYIAYISDKTGEDEIYLIKQDGSETAVQLTKNTNIYKFELQWSPDSKKILWNDQKFRLQYIDIDTKKVTLVHTSDIDVIYSFNWSPDSKWITYSQNEENGLKTVYLYSTETKVKTPITDGWYYSSQPTFSKDGKYLIFTSSRSFNPIYSHTEWNTSYVDMSKIYLVTLSKETKSPFAPVNDEVEIAKVEKKNAKAKKDKDKEDKTITLKVDLNGIQDRIVELPIKAANYWSIYGVNDKVYYCEYAHNSETHAKFYDLKKKKETTFANKIGFSFSANGKKMLVRKGKSYYIIDTPNSKIKLDKSVDLSNMKVFVDLRQEWEQIYNESWRQMRDFFYASNMHGLDWNAMHDKYAALLPYVNHRNDLTYIIGELIGELNVGHAYTGSGDRPKPKRINTGLLGAKLSRTSSGYYKIDKILKGENWNKSVRSPLTQIGVKAKEGDYIIAVNGKLTKDMNNIYQSLINTANKEVELTINSNPDVKGSHKTLVIPIADESSLYYYNWVENNIKKVNDATDGKVGYIHIPDMSSEGLNEFVKHFYPQLSKKALIIDDRGNGGGNVSPMIIERLRRELVYYDYSRNAKNGVTSPEELLVGPKVLLINQYSASDGDIFPYRFRKHKMGKIIGVRSWGGVVGITGSLPFIDGGTLTKPDFAPFDSKGWVIEGHGVDPDIVVENDPAKEYEGIDQQLNKAIEVVLDELKTQEHIKPTIPPLPDKTK